MSTRTEWPVVCIKDVCESIIDCVNKTAPTVGYPTPYKMIRTTNVRDGWINLDEVRFVEAEVFARWNRRATPRKGDVILTREAPLGEVGMLRSNDHVFLGQRLVLYRADPIKLDDRFLLYSFRCDHLQGQIKSLGSGATVEHMRVPDAEKLLLRLPPLPIQKRIGDILSAYDDLIENNAHRITILEDMAQMVYREWFVSFRFPGHEKVVWEKSELGRSPQGWVCPYPDHVDYLEGPGLRRWQYRDSGLRFLNIRTISDGDIDLTKTQFIDPQEAETKYRHFLLAQYDHVVSSSGTIGRLVTVRSDHLPLMLNTSVIRMRPRSGRMGKWQLKHFLQSPYFLTQIHSLASGVAQANFGPFHLRQMKLIAPPAELGIAYEKIVDPLEVLILNLRRKGRILRHTRELLLPKLISGEVSVENWAPEAVAQGV